MHKKNCIKKLRKKMIDLFAFAFSNCIAANFKMKLIQKKCSSFNRLLLLLFLLFLPLFKRKCENKMRWDEIRLYCAIAGIVSIEVVFIIIITIKFMLYSKWVWSTLISSFSVLHTKKSIRTYLILIYGHI